MELYRTHDVRTTFSREGLWWCWARLSTETQYKRLERLLNGPWKASGRLKAEASFAVSGAVEMLFRDLSFVAFFRHLKWGGQQARNNTAFRGAFQPDSCT